MYRGQKNFSEMTLSEQLNCGDLDIYICPEADCRLRFSCEANLEYHMAIMHPALYKEAPDGKT